MEKREIKFRAWDIKDKRMLTSSERAIDLSGKIYNDSEDWYYGFDDRKGYYEGDDVIIMQYTGLKDKNGTEIYEGDITKGLTGYIFTIVFYDGSFNYKSSHHHPLKDKLFPMNKTSAESSEVIGNIYDKKEV